jgi:phosphoribosyl-ATP pyrophosphohydrolase
MVPGGADRGLVAAIPSRRRIVFMQTLASPMAVFDKTSPEDIDAIRQLEMDLKAVGADPSRFPRTNKLLSAGVPQQAKKVVEEAAELAIEAMRNERDAAVLEAADLVYNLVVLLEGMDIRFDDVCVEMKRRRQLYGIAARQQKNGNPRSDAS